jgi:hypothetical protein
MSSSRGRGPGLALALLLLLSACASTGPGGRLQPAGTTTVFDMTLTSDLDWARIKAHRNEMWTIDGLLLNRLMIFSNVAPGEHVFQRAKERRSRPDGPWFRAGMRLDELEQLVVDGLVDQDWVGVTAHDPRPHDFGGVEGLRFDLHMTHPDGLVYEGTAAVVEHEGKLTVLVWLAPKEHYYGRDIVAVNAMLDGVRFN